MGRIKRATEHPLNAATFLQNYRNATARMLALTIAKKRTCPCCKVSRSVTQFDEGKAACKNCSRPR